MISARRIGATAAIALAASAALAAPALGGAAGQPTSAPSDTPAKDTFNGHIVAGSGRYAGRQGAVTIHIHTGSWTKSSRRATFTIDARRCSGARPCLRLSGTLEGTLTHQKTIPDTGERYAVAVHGTSAPLGTTHGSGSVAGPGFIAYGHEQLQLTLTGRHGTITIHAFSPRVRGFTSP